MEIETTEHYLTTQVRGRYLLRGPEKGAAKGLIIGFHGYGQRGEDLLDPLSRVLGDMGWVVCSVQALHPFYVREGEVGASWMTCLDREKAIEDNLEYVAKVVSEVKQAHQIADPLVYFGYSQGTAMAFRAAFKAGHASCGVLALGGDVPPEFSEQMLSGFPPVLLCRGTKDKFYSEEQFAEDALLLQAKGVALDTFSFSGGHGWTEELEQRIQAFLQSLHKV